VFTPSDLRKQDRPGHKRMAVIVPAFEGDSLICPLQCLTSYIGRTSPLRSESKEGPLFISFLKPHKLVSSASVARWLKSVLSSAGIEGFTAHSTRGAGTSKAALSGLSMQEIMRLADWSREFTSSSTTDHCPSTLKGFWVHVHFRSCIVINFLISNYSYLVTWWITELSSVCWFLLCFSAMWR